jgi:hypothetical protein
MKPDKQYVAFAGKPDGSIIMVDYRQPEGFTHTAIRLPGDYTQKLVHLGIIDCPAGYEDALKGAVADSHVAGPADQLDHCILVDGHAVVADRDAVAG